MVLKPCLWCKFRVEGCEIRDEIKRKTVGCGLSQGSFKCAKFTTQFEVGEEVTTLFAIFNDDGYSLGHVDVMGVVIGWKKNKALVYIYPDDREHLKTCDEKYPVVGLRPLGLRKVGNRVPCCGGCGVPIGQKPGTEYNCAWNQGTTDEEGWNKGPGCDAAKALAPAAKVGFDA